MRTGTLAGPPRRRSTFFPAIASSAGNSVIATSTATVTMIAAATPIQRTNGSPMNDSPRSDVTTTAPAKTTDLPAVPSARPIASGTSMPRARFSRWRATMKSA